jgi:hypothetical protein
VVDRATQELSVPAGGHGNYRSGAVVNISPNLEHYELGSQAIIDNGRDLADIFYLNLPSYLWDVFAERVAERNRNG